MHDEQPIRVLMAMDRLGYGEGQYHGAGRLVVEWGQALRARNALGLADDALVVASVARFNRVKGVDILAEAWPTVAREVPSAHLLMVGEGPLHE